MITRKSRSTTSRQLALVGVLLLVTLTLALAGCSGDGDDEPAVCGSLEDLSADVDKLKDVDLQAGDGAVAEIAQDVDSIRAGFEVVKTDAQAQFSGPIAGLDSALAGLSTEVNSMKGTGTVTAQSAQTLLSSLAEVSTSWVALKDAAPSCDL